MKRFRNNFPGLLLQINNNFTGVEEKTDNKTLWPPSIGKIVSIISYYVDGDGDTTDTSNFCTWRHPFENHVYFLLHQVGKLCTLLY